MLVEQWQARLAQEQPLVQEGLQLLDRASQPQRGQARGFLIDFPRRFSEDAHQAAALLEGLRQTLFEPSHCDGIPAILKQLRRLVLRLEETLTARESSKRESRTPEPRNPGASADKTSSPFAAAEGLLVLLETREAILQKQWECYRYQEHIASSTVLELLLELESFERAWEHYEQAATAQLNALQAVQERSLPQGMAALVVRYHAAANGSTGNEPAGNEPAESGSAPNNSDATGAQAADSEVASSDATGAQAADSEVASSDAARHEPAALERAGLDLTRILALGQFLQAAYALIRAILPSTSGEGGEDHPAAEGSPAAGHPAKGYPANALAAPLLLSMTQGEVIRFKLAVPQPLLENYRRLLWALFLGDLLQREALLPVLLEALAREWGHPQAAKDKTVIARLRSLKQAADALPPQGRFEVDDKTFPADALPTVEALVRYFEERQIAYTSLFGNPSKGKARRKGGSKARPATAKLSLATPPPASSSATPSAASASTPAAIPTTTSHARCGIVCCSTGHDTICEVFRASSSNRGGGIGQTQKIRRTTNHSAAAGCTRRPAAESSRRPPPARTRNHPRLTNPRSQPRPAPDPESPSLIHPASVSRLHHVSRSHPVSSLAASGGGCRPTDRRPSRQDLGAGRDRTRTHYRSASSAAHPDSCRKQRHQLRHALEPLREHPPAPA